MSDHIIVKPGEHLTIPQYETLTGEGYNANYGTIRVGQQDGISSPNIAINLIDQVDARGNIEVPATLNNVGTLTDVNVYGDADAKIVNSGTINVDDATFNDLIGVYVGPNIMGTGTINIGNRDDYGRPLQGRMEVGQVSAGQTVNLRAGLLDLLDPIHFLATVTNFSTGDYIDVRNIAATSETYDNGRLTLFEGTKAVDVIHLKRPAGATFSTSSFHLDVYNGLTEITTDNTIHSHF